METLIWVSNYPQLTNTTHAFEVAMGYVARFSGGYLQAPLSTAPDVTSKQMTLCTRIQDPTGLRNAPLFGSYGSESQVSIFMNGTDGASKPFAIYHGSRAATHEFFGPKYQYGNKQL